MKEVDSINTYLVSGKILYSSVWIEALEPFLIKDPENEKMGDELEDFLINCFKRLGLAGKVIHHPHGRGKNDPVDFGYPDLGLEIEAKNYDKMKKYYISPSGFHSSIIDRSKAENRLAIVTCEKWGETCNSLLVERGWSKIVIGAIETPEQRELAFENFSKGWTKFVEVKKAERVLYSGVICTSGFREIVKKTLSYNAILSIVSGNCVSGNVIFGSGCVESSSAY